jgi:hypothetical protein
MNKQLILLFVILIMPLCMVHGQADLKINKKEFKTVKTGFKEAWANVAEGDSYYSQGGGLYTDAMEKYMKALEYNSENAELNYKTGVSCLYGNFPDRAIDYFIKAGEINPELTDDLVLLTGLAYQSRGDFGLALDCFNLYSDMNVESGKFDSRVNRYIKECNAAISMSSNPVMATVTNLGSKINSSEDDYSPVTSVDNTLLYFTSRRDINDTKRNESDMKYDESIFMSTKTGDNWNPPGIAGKNVATEVNEGVLSVDNNNTVMYIYAGWSGKGDIFTSVLRKGKWSIPMPVNGGINTPSRETSFTVTSMGDERFFTSDRKKGGLGGRDIWYSKKFKKDRWTKPINLGSEINSTGNEESVWVSPSGDTLWFSSNGLNEMGGYDVYVSYRDTSGSWSAPENMGQPINSQWDDMFFHPLSTQKSVAYLASNRPGGEGGFDIYQVVYNDADTVKVQLQDSINIQVADTEQLSFLAPVPEMSDSLLVPPADSLLINQADTLPAVPDTLIILK